MGVPAVMRERPFYFIQLDWLAKEGGKEEKADVLGLLTFEPTIIDSGKAFMLKTHT